MIIKSLHTSIKAEWGKIFCSLQSWKLWSDHVSSSAFWPRPNLTSFSLPWWMHGFLLPLDNLPYLALRDCFHGDVLGHLLSLDFSLFGCVAWVSTLQILLKVLHSPETSFLGTDAVVTPQLYLPYPQEQALNWFYLWNISKSFVLLYFPNNPNPEFYFIFAWNYHNHLSLVFLCFHIVIWLHYSIA